jgi:hypothetical protein
LAPDVRDVVVVAVDAAGHLPRARRPLRTRLACTVDGNIGDFCGLTQPRRLTGSEFFLASMRSERRLATILEIRDRALAGQIVNWSECRIAEDVLSLFGESS